jgi:hypothetical protein
MENISERLELKYMRLLTDTIIVLVVVAGALFCPHGYYLLELCGCFLEAGGFCILDCWGLTVWVKWVG